MLLGELPDLEETRAGKELIEIGEQRGEQRGKLLGEKLGITHILLKQLAKQFGPVPAEVENRIRQLTVDQLSALGENVFGYDSLQDVEKWMAEVGLEGTSTQD